MTTNLIRQNHDRYLNDHAFLRLLGEHNICIPSNFLLKEGQAAIEAFWNTYYPEGPPRTPIFPITFWAARISAWVLVIQPHLTARQHKEINLNC